MACRARETLANQVEADILSAVRSLAQREGRPRQALADEAPADLIEKRKQGRPRAHVMAAHGAGHETFSGLYKKLAE